MKTFEIFEIENQVWNSVKSETRIGLLDGLSGIALFYSYLFEVYEDEKYATRLFEVVERIDGLISENRPLSTFCSGLAGYGWMLLNLKKNTVTISEAYFETLDTILEEALLSFSDKNEYDFLHGAIGLAMYFIERKRVAKNNGKASKVLDRFSEDLLYKLNNDFDKVITSIEGKDAKEKIIYFGLAHGISGFINFLFYLNKNIKSLETETNQAIIKLIDFMTSQKSFNKISNQFYPNCIDLEGTIREARFGWCQGDLGIGLALYNASKLLKNDQIKNTANELIVATEKVSFKTSLVRDFGLCHGSSGLVIQYYLAQQKCKFDTKKAHTKWYKELEKQTLNFTVFKRHFRGDYIEEFNILEGSSGLGLVLLTLDGKIKNDWLRCLNLY